MVGQNKLTREKFDASITSWTAYAGFSNSWRLRKKIDERIKVCFATNIFVAS